MSNEDQVHIQDTNAEQIINFPPFEVDGLLNKHTWKQCGQELVCLDDPSLSGILPLGYALVGEPGKYRLEKIF